MINNKTQNTVKRHAMHKNSNNFTG